MAGRRKAITYAPKRKRKAVYTKAEDVKLTNPVATHVEDQTKMIKKLMLVLQAGTAHWVTYNNTKRILSLFDELIRLL